jgi:MFS family permease
MTPQGCLLLLSGRIADIISRKYTFILGMFLFCVFSLGCGLVRDSQAVPFFILRALAGLGASLGAPSAIGIIAENHPEGRRRSIMYAAYGAGNPIGAAVGVLLGGSLADSGR